MLFSKYLLPVFGLLSVASFAVATPILAPDAIVTRDTSATDVTDVLSLVQSLDSSLTSMLNSQQKTDANALVSQLETTVTGVTSNIKKANLKKADVHAVISISINIFVTIVAILGKFSIVDLVLGARIDVFLGAFVSSLEVFSPGIGSIIGAGIPSINLGIFVFLRLVISIRILGLGGLLGGLLGIIGIIL